MAASAGSSAKALVKKVRPLLSLDKKECRSRVINLYKAWYRGLTVIDKDFTVPVLVPEMRKKLKEEFMKNRNIEDIRVIDMLVIKGEMELKEVALNHKQSCHIMYFFKDTAVVKSPDFLSKFLDGRD